MPDRTVGMKLHERLADSDDWRIVEFWTEDGKDFQIATVPTMDSKPSTIHLTRREAKALRHWLDAALGDTPS